MLTMTKKILAQAVAIAAAGLTFSNVASAAVTTMYNASTLLTQTMAESGIQLY
jgi:hypothetical protein